MERFEVVSDARLVLGGRMPLNRLSGTYDFEMFDVSRQFPVQKSM